MSHPPSDQPGDQHGHQHGHQHGRRPAGRHDDQHGPGPADSSGLPWAHRELTGTGFHDDPGAGDPAVLAMLHLAASAPSSDTETALLRAVATARWLVPIVAVAVDTELHAGLRVEGHSEMAAVTLERPDGSKALPVFSSLASLAAWDPVARPVPVTADRAAQAAVAEGCDTLLLDLGQDHALALRPSMIWALAMQREWQPAHDDPVVAAGVDAALAGEPHVLAHRLTEGEPPAAGVLRVTLALRAGLDSGQVQALATRVGERIATDGELRARIDGLAFSIRSAR